MFSTFVPETYGSGKPLLCELFDVRIPYREELTTCHVVLVNNVSKKKSFDSFQEPKEPICLIFINNFTQRQLVHERHE